MLFSIVCHICPTTAALREPFAGQWGDEGKGKLSDVLAKGYDIVGRFNGGDNAGHTVRLRPFFKCCTEHKPETAPAAVIWCRINPRRPGQVVVEGKKFAFHLVPCGVVYEHTQNVLGNGVVIHIPQMFNELAPLTEQGISWEGRMKMSNRAHLLFQFHREIDGMMEARRGDANIGTTKKGIGPCYSTKAFRFLTYCVC